MTASQSPLRPRIRERDILPILATGLVVAGAILASRKTLTAEGVGSALAIGIGFMLALAGIQGRAEMLTPRGAVIGWLKLMSVTIVVAIATGDLAIPGTLRRLVIFLVASLGASLLLFLLRTRRR